MNVKVQRRSKSAGRNSPPNSAKEARTPAEALRPATVAMPAIKPKYPVAELIRSALKGAIARLQAADPEARRGEPEGVHRLRHRPAACAASCGRLPTSSIESGATISSRN